MKGTSPGKDKCVKIRENGWEHHVGDRKFTDAHRQVMLLGGIKIALPPAKRLPTIHLRLQPAFITWFYILK